MVGRSQPNTRLRLTSDRLMNHPFLSPPLSFNGEAVAFSDKLPNHTSIVELYPSRNYE